MPRKAGSSAAQTGSVPPRSSGRDPESSSVVAGASSSAGALTDRRAWHCRHAWLELVLALALLALTMLYLIKAWRLPGSAIAGDIGSATFPLLIGSGSLIALVLWLSTTLWRWCRDGERQIELSRPGAVGLAVVTLLLVAPAFAALGSVTALLLCCALLLMAAGERRPVVVGVASVVMVTVIYLLFAIVLQIDLPRAAT